MTISPGGGCGGGGERALRRPPDPVAHVRCQMREAVAQVFRAFVSAKVFETQDVDAFVLLGADLMIDEQLNVRLSEMQSGPGLPDNTPAIKQLLAEMLPDVVDLVLHVRDGERANGAPRFPLPETGFELLVDGAKYPESPHCRAEAATRAAANNDAPSPSTLH